MIVMEFFAGAREIGEAEVDDQVIDSGLRLIRQLWDAGLAHRDIKPAKTAVNSRRSIHVPAHRRTTMATSYDRQIISGVIALSSWVFDKRRLRRTP